VRLHIGTADVPGELILLDRDALEPGADGLVQLRLSAPIACAPGDRFVLRLLSPVITLGGGVVIEESRWRLKRHKPFILGELTGQEESLRSPAGLLEAILARFGDEMVTTKELAHAIKRPDKEARTLLSELHAEGRIVEPRSDHWMHQDRLAESLGRLSASIDGWFTEHAHRGRLEVIELRRKTSMDAGFLGAMLGMMEQEGRVELLSGGFLRLPGSTADPEAGLSDLAKAVRACLAAAGCQPPGQADVAAALGADEGEVGCALEALVDCEAADRVGGEMVFARSAIEEARAAVQENCERNGKLVIPELRDKLETSRKFLIPLLEFFDAGGLTIRQAGHRVLRRR